MRNHLATGPPLTVGVQSLRLLAGSVMVVRPAWLARALGVDSTTATQTSWITQMAGGRDLVLALGVLSAVRSGDRRGVQRWLAACAVADTVDAVGVSRALRRGDVSRFTGAVVAISALGAAGVGVFGACSTKKRAH